jgi:alpha-galactosidase/6-phospho-beta-glucosidase family protein
MTPRIVVVGGGSVQWAPKLLRDLANTPSLEGAEVVLEDIDGAAAERMAMYVDHVASLRRIPMSVRATTDQRGALDGADFVVVAISTGGFASMRHDLDVPAQFGVVQAIGDTVGPGGIFRGLRNIPVLVGLAQDMEALCPEAWMLSVTNPMSSLCRAVTRETSIKTVGLCHEVTITHFLLSLLLEVGYFDIDMDVAGVNHLPIIVNLRVDGQDGLVMLRELLDGDPAALDQPLSIDLPHAVLHGQPRGEKWTKRDVLERSRIKLDLFDRHGVLPGAGDRHVAEFFSEYLSEATGWGDSWGVQRVPIEVHERSQFEHLATFEADLESPEVSRWPSGEMVAPLIDSLLTGQQRFLPLNVPNDGSIADLPVGALVETIGVVGQDGVRPRQRIELPKALGRHVVQISRSQDLTVEAAVSGNRQLIVEAVAADPLSSRVPEDQRGAMIDALLAATRPWLPQFV